jgi:sugar lactone lactonase YvrE
MTTYSLFKKSAIVSLAMVAVVFGGSQGASAALYGAANLAGQIEAGAPYYTSGNPDDAANPRGFSSNSDTLIDTAGNRAFVVDSANNRVVVFNLTAGGAFVDRVADAVLGQANFKTNAAGTTQGQMSLSGTSGLAFDAAGQRLFVSDTLNNRVMVFNVTAITNGENAVNVLGQTNFTNNAAATTQNGLSVPAGLTYNAATNRLFVADSANNRVMVYDVAAITDGENAVNVVGQANYISTSYTSDWVPSLPTSEGGIESFAIDSANNVLYAGTGTMNGTSHSGIIYRCSLATACDDAGDWTVSYDPAKRIIQSLAIDTTNGVMYAGTYEGGAMLGGTIYRCVLATACDAAGDWTVSYDTPTWHVASLLADTADGVLYAGTGNEGGIYRCVTSSGCDAAGDWTQVFSGEVILTFQKDAANGVIYAGSGYANETLPKGVIYRCVTSTGCDTQSEWTTSYDPSSSSIGSILLDSGNSVLYAGADGVAVYRCSLATACDDAGDWTVSLDTPPGMPNLPDAVWSLVQDAANGFIYASTGNYGLIYRCSLATACDANSDWTLNATQDDKIIDAFVLDSTNGVLYAGTSYSNQFYPSGILLRCALFTGCRNRLGMNNPQDVAYASATNRLYVADTGNNRVLVYDMAVITNGEPAINVLGQADDVSKVAATTQAGLSAPMGVEYSSTGTRLFVSDTSNNRVMVYDVAAITDGENAVNVVGQPDFVSNVWNITQNGSGYPAGLGFDLPRQKLYVAEPANNRVMVYDLVVTTNGENAVDILGQTNPNDTPLYTNAGVNNSPGDVGFNVAAAVALDAVNHRLFVADQANARVMVFNLTVANALTNYNADFVLGQADFKTHAYGVVSQSILGSADGLAYDSANQRLFVSDTMNNRIMVFNVAAITNGENAVNVLGQTNYTNNGAASTQAGLSSPVGLLYHATSNRLYVADSANNRVIIYDVAAITNGENAANVLGQTNFTNSAAATTQGGLSGPTAVTINGTAGAGSRVYVADTINNRVIVYNTGNGITNGENAVNVLGQTLYTTNTAATTQAGLSGPRGLAYDTSRNRLHVADATNNRLITYDLVAITNGENAVDVFGQTDYVSSGAGVTPSRMNTPMGLSYDAGLDYLIAADTYNHRVMFFNLAAPVISPFMMAIGDPLAQSLALSAPAGDTVTYDLALAQAPTAPVTITLNEVDPDNVAYVKDRVIFTKANWKNPKKVNIKARRKARRTPGDDTVTIQSTASSADPAFNGIAIPDVMVTVTR